MQAFANDALEIDRIADQELDSPRPNRASNSDGVAMRKGKQGKVVSRQARKREPVASPVTETSVEVNGAPRAQLLIFDIARSACVVVRLFPGFASRKEFRALAKAAPYFTDGVLGQGRVGHETCACVALHWASRPARNNAHTQVRPYGSIVRHTR